MENLNYPPCGVNKCAANEKDHCLALTQNNFGDRKCPFYKTKEQNEKELKYCQKRMAELEIRRNENA